MMASARSDATPQVSVITVCKGRREQLTQVIGQRHWPRVEQIVVDSRCPDGTAEWLEREHPWVQVVRHDDQGRFNLSGGRNAGVPLARAPWLLFIDADACVTPPFWPALLARLETAPTTEHGIPHRAADQAEQPGQLLISQQAFAAVGGYDDVIQDWGSEDRDILLKLARLGSVCRPFSQGWAGVLAHDDALRTAHYRAADRFDSMTRNRWYVQIKSDLAQITGVVELPRTWREKLYAQVVAALADSHDGTGWLDLQLPDLPGVGGPRGLTLRRRWRYELVRQAGPNGI